MTEHIYILFKLHSSTSNMSITQKKITFLQYQKPQFLIETNYEIRLIEKIIKFLMNVLIYIFNMCSIYMIFFLICIKILSSVNYHANLIDLLVCRALGSNNFSGALPPEIGNLAKLENL